MSPAAAATSTSTRWCPTPEQLMILEEMYRGGVRTPSATQIQHITGHLSRYGKIEGKNVFYWFQNHKARDRQKLRRRLAKQITVQQQQQQLVHRPADYLYSTTMEQHFQKEQHDVQVPQKNSCHLLQFHEQPQCYHHYGAAAAPAPAASHDFGFHQHYNTNIVCPCTKPAAPQASYLPPHQNGSAGRSTRPQMINYLKKVDMMDTEKKKEQKSTASDTTSSKMYGGSTGHDHDDWLIITSSTDHHVLEDSTTRPPLKTLDLFPTTSSTN